MTHTKILSILNKEVDLQKLCSEIELATGIKLMAKNPSDTVEGFINHTQFKDGSTFTEVFTYDSDEIPNKLHKSTLKRKICTELEKTNIQAAITAHIKV